MKLGSQAVTLLRRTVTGVDEDGNDVYAAVPLTLTGCSVQPRVSSEDGSGRVQIISGLMLYAPADLLLVTGHDIVEYDGRRYEVDGDPALWRTSGGAISHQEVALRRVTG